MCDEATKPTEATPAETLKPYEDPVEMLGQSMEKTKEELENAEKFAQLVAVSFQQLV